LEKFCSITPTRGDRPKLLAHCKWQLSRMTLKPDKSYFIDYKPKNGDKDLIQRVNYGIIQAQTDGFDKVYIVEDDDFYKSDYFERMAFDGDFIGDQSTTYYHIINQGFQTEYHRLRASLFTTGFRISSLKRFAINGVKKVFLDIDMWNYARQNRLRCKFVDSGAIGIKHGVGITGGIGHKQGIYKNFDKEWKWLSSRVDSESLAFYQGLQKELRG